MFKNDINKYTDYMKFKHYRTTRPKKKSPTKEDVVKATEEFLKNGGKIKMMDCTFREETG